jgi:hypothetical protein
MGLSFHFSHETMPNPIGKMRVILGGHTVKAFVSYPKHFHVIGIVQFGMEFGLLALSHGGDYCRINGSELTWLDNRDVEDAIYRSKHTGRGESFAASRTGSHTGIHR